MNGLRKCKGSAHMYVNGKWEHQDFELGYFHQWGVNYEELRDGVGSYMVAIVELPDGRVIMPVADEIIFLSEESNI